MAAQSPTALGAFRWWRCDQSLSLDGSNLVTDWTDVIGSAVLSQSTPGDRPGITSGRFTTTAVNFTTRGQRLVSGEAASTYKFLVDGSACHVLIVLKVLDTGANLDCILATSNNAFGAPYFIAAWDNRTASLLVKRFAAFLTNNSGTVVLDTPQAADNTFPNNTNTLYEYAYEENGSGSTDGFGYINHSNVWLRDRVTIPLATNNPTSTLTLGGVNDAGTTTYGLQGYIEDVVIFKRRLNSGDQTDLRDYFRELRGVPTAIFNETSTTGFSFDSATTDNLIQNIQAANITYSFDTSGSPTQEMNLDETLSFQFDTDGNLIGSTVLAGDTSFALDVSGAPNLNMAVTGDTALAIDTSGNLIGATQLSGDVTFSLEPAGELSKTILIASNLIFGFDTAGDLQSNDLHGSTDFGFSTAASLEYIWKGLTGDASFAFQTTGSVLGPEITGATDFNFGTAGALVNQIPLSGVTAFGLGTSGELSHDAGLSGSTNFSFGPSGYIGIAFPETGLTRFAFNTAANLIKSGAASEMAGAISTNTTNQVGINQSLNSSVKAWKMSGYDTVALTTIYWVSYENPNTPPPTTNPVVNISATRIR